MSASQVDNGEYVPYLSVLIPDQPQFMLLISASLKMRIEHPGCEWKAVIDLASGAFSCDLCGLTGQLDPTWVCKRVATPGKRSKPTQTAMF